MLRKHWKTLTWYFTTLNFDIEPLADAFQSLISRSSSAPRFSFELRPIFLIEMDLRLSIRSGGCVVSPTRSCQWLISMELSPSVSQRLIETWNVSFWPYLDAGISRKSVWEIGRGLYQSHYSLHRNSLSFISQKAFIIQVNNSSLFLILSVPAVRLSCPSSSRFGSPRTCRWEFGSSYVLVTRKVFAKSCNSPW